MAFTAPIIGTLITPHVKPSTTGATALVVADQETVVYALRFTNRSGSSRTVDLTHYVASADASRPIIGAVIAVADGAHVDHELPGAKLLAKGDELRVTVSAADALECEAFGALRP
jgi:hypothetical protein